MSSHVFRNADKFEVQPHREYLRGPQFPDGRQGFVVEDLDLVLRVFGPNFRTDDTGRFRLVEMKFGTAPLGASKERTFGMIDRLLRGADPQMVRYDGFYVVRYDNPNWAVANLRVNGTDLTGAEFDAWLQFSPDVVIAPMVLAPRWAA